jgi:hypothetical protein
VQSSLHISLRISLLAAHVQLYHPTTRLRLCWARHSQVCAGQYPRFNNRRGGTLTPAALRRPQDQRRDALLPGHWSPHLESPRHVTTAPFPRPASASHLPPKQPMVRGASSVLVLPLLPVPCLFLAISLTRVCTSHPCPASPLAQGLRFAAGLPAMGRHAFGPPGGRRFASRRHTTHSQP